MSSVLRSVRKRKKGRTLGAVDIIDRAEYAELEVDAKVELIRSLVPLGLMHIEELLDEEVTALAGERYARKDPAVGGRRHGSNPGTVGLAGQRVPIRVPRIRHVTEREIPLRSYEALHGDRAVNDRLLTRVLYGISCRNYAAAAARRTSIRPRSEQVLRPLNHDWLWRTRHHPDHCLGRVGPCLGHGSSDLQPCRSHTHIARWKRSPAQYKVTNSDCQSEHCQRAHQHHHTPRDNLHVSPSSLLGYF